MSFLRIKGANTIEICSYVTLQYARSLTICFKVEIFLFCLAI